MIERRHGLQTHLALIPHEVRGEMIYQRPIDGYINATAMCSAAGKAWSGYNRLGTTTAFIAALSADLQIHTTELVQSVSGGRPEFQGTWVHPRVAVHLASWCSPEFAVKVTGWVWDWMNGRGAPKAPPTLPAFIRRANENWDRVEVGYFSIINELFTRLYGRFEMAGYVLADRAPNGTENRIDVSVGKTFAAWLDKHHPSLISNVGYYAHKTDQWEGPARQYPNSMLHWYIEFVETVWIPEYAEKYFRPRDVQALPYLQRLLPSVTRARPGMVKAPTAKSAFKRPA